MREYYLLSMLFVVVAGITYGLLSLLFRPRRPLDARLAPEGDGVGEEWSEPPGEPMLVTQRGQATLQAALRRAGYYRPGSLTRYTTLRAFLVVVPLMLDAAVALLLPTDKLRMALFAGVTLSVLGFSVPRLILSWRSRQRARAIEKALPFAVDLLSVTLSAGQNTLSALRHVSRELRFSHPVLASELDIVHEQARLSSLGHALQQLAERVALPEARNLALLLIQSERLGTDASAALLEFSSHQRTNLRQRAETQANRTTFWMMFPSVCCLWVAGSLVLIGPLYYQFWQGWTEAAQRTNQMKGEVERANPKPGTPPAAPEAPALEPNAP
jgi:tight adherence protein C